jgi:cell division septation protein DedD
MRNSDTGEFELVVGNRQLLSGFFIVILLLAVTFAMGYVVGQNSPRSTKTADASPAPGTTDGRPQPVGAVPTPVTPAATPVVQQASDGAAPVEPAAVTTTAATTTPAAAPAPPVAAPSAGGSQAPSGPVTDLPPGSYWQVMAVGTADAQVVVRTLRDMGLPALMSPAPSVPNRGSLMRVLVGPYSDSESMGRAKSKLENEGFHPIKK